MSNDEKGFTILGSCGTIEASVATKNRGDAGKKLAGFSEEYGLLADFDKEADLMFDLLLINGCVITVDSAHTVYQPGYVAVEKDTIAAIGPMSDLPVLPEAGRVIDLCGHAVLPGLVDAHGHAGHCLIKNLFEYRDDWDDLAGQVYYQCTDTEFWRAEGSLAAAERIKFGITTGVSMVGSTPRIDIIEPVGANLEGSSRVGIRQLSGIGCANGPWPKKARAWNGKEYTESTVTPKMAYRSTEEALKAYNGRHPLETCIVAPGRMGLRPGESAEDNIAHNREMYRLAEEYGVPLHTHAFAGDIQFLYDTTPEVLKVGLSLTHSTGLSQEEIAILAKTGAYVFHGPATHSNILKTCPVYELLQAGAHVAVVTDGTAPDRSYDIWRDMKMLQVLQRGRFHDLSLLPCGKVLELCTIEPAKALKLDHLIGSLEVGKKADIIAVDVEQPHLAPFGDMPVQRLVYHAMGQDVDLTIVDGAVVMEGRKLTKVDEKKIIADARGAYATMLERLGDPTVTQNPKLYELTQKM